MGEIEDTIFENNLAVNTRAMLSRGIQLLDEAGCNNALSLKGDLKFSYNKLMWLLFQQVHGHMAIVNMADEWNLLLERKRLMEEVKEMEIKHGLRV